MRNQENKSRWLAAYERALVEVWGNDEQWMTHLRLMPRFASAKTDAEKFSLLAQRMTEGFATGGANKDSKAVRMTCKAMGIKHTYTAIRAFLNS